MKRIFTTTAILISGVATFAQTPSIYTPESLPAGSTTAQYDQTITFSIPATTEIDPAVFGLPAIAATFIGTAPLPATIDTVSLSVAAPNGITATFDNGNGIYAAGASGSIHLTGTPTSIAMDTVSILSATNGSVTVQGQTINFPGAVSVPIVGDFPVPAAPRVFDKKYPMSVTNSIEDLDRNTFSVIQNIPNPFTGTTVIAFSTPVVSKVTLMVFDLLGKEISSQIIQAKSGVNEVAFDGSGLKEGIYFYSLINETKTFTQKMQVSK